MLVMNDLDTLGVATKTAQLCRLCQSSPEWALGIPVCYDGEFGGTGLDECPNARGQSLNLGSVSSSAGKNVSSRDEQTVALKPQTPWGK